MEEECRNIMESIEMVAAGEGLQEADIPNIDLYMDQVITLISDQMGGKSDKGKTADNDKLLTKTMINNYSKDGVLGRIKGKKYSKQHILMMLVIYNLKQALSMQDIKQFIEGLAPDIWDGAKGQYNAEKVSWIYESCLQANTLAEKELPQLARQMLGTMPTSPAAYAKEQSVAAVFMLCALATLSMRSAQEILKSNFTVLPKPKKTVGEQKTSPAETAEP